MLETCDKELKQDIARLLCGETIHRCVNLYIANSYKQSISPDLVYGFLSQVGYLAIKAPSTGYGYYAIFVPNQEVMLNLQYIVSKYLIDVHQFHELYSIRTSLASQYWDLFSDSLLKLTQYSLECIFTSELSYYGLIMCLSSALGLVGLCSFEYTDVVGYLGVKITYTASLPLIVFINFKQSLSVEEMEEDAKLAEKDANIKLHSVKYEEAHQGVSYGVSIYDKQVFVAPYEMRRIKITLADVPGK